MEESLFLIPFTKKSLLYIQRLSPNDPILYFYYSVASLERDKASQGGGEFIILHYISSNLSLSQRLLYQFLLLLL